jgi:hypothetical protein
VLQDTSSRLHRDRRVDPNCSNPESTRYAQIDYPVCPDGTALGSESRFRFFNDAVHAADEPFDYLFSSEAYAHAREGVEASNRASFDGIVTEETEGMLRELWRF